jgi:hypothetical protein
MPLLIYIQKLTPRKTYVFNHILVDILGLDYAFTTYELEFKNYDHEKFSYSYLPIGNELHFKQHHFIDEDFVEEQELIFGRLDTIKIPFSVNDGAFSSDIFSVAFYLLSRYEEYLSSKKDTHNRYSAENSLAYKCGFLQNPIIDIWAYELFGKLKERFPNLKYSSRKFTFTPTIDIDQPYYLKTETFFRKNLKIIKSLLKGELSILKQDPYNTYFYLKDIHQLYNLHPTFFFLLGNQHFFDDAPNLNASNSAYKLLIQSIEKYAKVGIHPSYQSNKNIEILKTEIKQLASVLNDKNITISRQHYLKLNLPDTYKKLISSGINADYTMGYASQLGFRASTCTPFFWYDLQNETTTDLKIYPFAVMDQTLKKYLNLNPEEAIAQIKLLVDEVKKVNGTFISLWHNETLSNFASWKHWRKVYNEMLDYASKS